VDPYVKGWLLCMVVAAMCVSLIPDIYNSYTIERRAESVSDERIREVVGEEIGPVNEVLTAHQGGFMAVNERLVRLEQDRDGVEDLIERAQWTADTALANSEAVVGRVDDAAKTAKSARDIADSVNGRLASLSSQSVTVADVQAVSQRVDTLEKAATASSEVSHNAQIQANQAIEIAETAGKPGWFVVFGAICGVVALAGCGYLVWRWRRG